MKLFHIAVPKGLTRFHEAFFRTWKLKIKKKNQFLETFTSDSAF